MELNVLQSLPIRYFSSVRAKKIAWLWYPYIPFGKVTIIQGDPGDGKTTLVLNIASLLSNALPMPGFGNQGAFGKVIYQSAEDCAEDTIKPRLVAAGADCSQIAFIDESAHGLSLCSDRLESAIKEIGAQMMVIDPLQAFIGDSGDMNRADGIRPMMKHLASVADRTGCAIVIVGHMNKSSGSKGIYRGLGSIDITAAARSVLLVGKLKSDPSIRIMAQIKNSLAEEGSPIAFEINEDSKVRWIGEYDLSVDELLSGEEAQTDHSKLSQAVECLKDILSGGEIPCVQVYEQMSANGISRRSVERAKKQLAIKSNKHADGWYWSL